VGLRADLDVLEKRKICFPTKIRTPDRLARSVVGTYSQYRLRYSGLTFRASVMLPFSVSSRPGMERE
jgi:hypothetical protein